MQAYEFQATLGAAKTVTLPAEIAPHVPADETVRIIVLVANDEQEEQDWKRWGAEQFFKGYAPEDSIYDQYDQLRPR